MGSKTNTQTTQSGPPANVASAYNSLLSRAQQVASTPYQAYSGSLLAPFSGSQQTAFNTIDQAQGIALPYLDQAQQYATQGAAAISPDQIQQYLNPYTQDVIRATQANFDEANARQLAQVRGNAIARGSLGGDRVGVAMGEAIRQQQLAQAPVIAGLNSQNYQTALSAAQQDAARRGQAAYTFGNLGQEALGTTLTGANAQLASGALQQQQAQAGLNIPYQQWLQEQAFPYQQTQWLAGITSGLGSQMGGTSTTTSPGPNQTAQYIGAGTAALGTALQFAPLLLSDKRAKSDIHKIGKTNDGQSIYRFRYKDDPHGTVHIGLLAQEVEKTNPDAVTIANGLRLVDYDKATKDSYAFGGAIRGYAEGGIATEHPWGAAARWIPGSTLVRGSGPPRAAPMATQDSGVNKMVSNAMGLAEQMRGQRSGIGQPLNLAPAGVSGAGDFYSPGVPVTGGLGPIYARGGFVAPQENGIYVPRGYADGGMPLNDLVYRPDFDVPGTNDLVYRPDVDTAPQFIPVAATAGSPASRIDQTYDAVTPLQQFPSLADVQARDAPPDVQAMVDNPPAIPLPAPRPASANAIPVASVATPDEPMAYAQGDTAPQPAIPLYDAMGPSAGYGQPPQPQGLRDRLHAIAPALVSAGFGMMASRSPFLGTAIGEGGLAGVHAYNDMKAIERDEAQRARQYGLQERGLDLRVRDLDQRAKQAADHLKLQTEQFAESKRQHRVPAGFREGPNGLEFIPGGPNDPAVIEAEAKAKRVSGLTDTAAEVAARQLLNGDMSPLTNYGRGAQGPDNINRIRGIATDILTNEMGMKPAEAAQHISSQIQKYKAAGIGQSAEARTAGTREANLNLILKATDAAIPAALEASKNVARTGWVPVNRIIQKGQVMASDPALREFGMANLQLAEHWARAMNPTGVMRESDRDLALEFLSTADSAPTYERVVKQLEKQIRRERDAIASTRGTGTSETAPKVGERKQFKQGWGVWDGSKYVPEKP